jgi:uncharacterized protein (TIGR02001 family)
MKVSPLFVLAAVAAIGFDARALAQDAISPAAPADAATTSTAAPPEWQLSYNFGAQSDYMFRGISQTDGRPSGFAGIDVIYKNQFYVGTWTSNVDFSPSGDTSTKEEVDLYGGWRPTIASINFDIGYIYYGYTHQPYGVRESYSEVYLKGTHAFGALTLGASAYHSPNFPGMAKQANYYAANASYTINPAWTASGEVGRQYESSAVFNADGRIADFNYTTWNAGVTYAINDHMSVDVRYWNTNQHGAGDPYHARVVAVLKATF